MTSSMLLVEGGGSHTVAFCGSSNAGFDETRFPSINQVGLSNQNQQDILRRVADVRKFLDVNLTYFAVGAASTNRYMDAFCEYLSKIWKGEEAFSEPVLVSNDIIPLMFSEPDTCNQLVVISGTGSGICARTGYSKVVRRGAHEFLLGDEGGAYDIGRRAIIAAIKMREDRGPRTILSKLAIEYTKGEELDWFVYQSDSSKQSVAAFAPYVFKASCEGDEVAERILDEAASRLAEVCDSALKALRYPSSVVATFTGTLLTEPSGEFRSRLKSKLASKSGVEHFESVAISPALMARTAEFLEGNPEVLTSIARAVPARRL